MTSFRTLRGTGFALALLLALGALAPSTRANAASEEFGQCLTSKGAVFFGASWCPKCYEQRRMLGPAMNYVRYVECSVGGERGEVQPACDMLRIESYPTWVFADGSRAGKQTPEKLAAKTGCKLSGAAGPSVDEADVDETDADGVRRREIGGALIIDIPK